MYSKTIVLAALLGSICLSQGVPLRAKLAQVAQADCDLNAQAAPLDAVTVAEPELEWCECGGVELPELGSGVQASNSLHAQVLQSTSVSSTPDVEQSTECLTNCCACNEANAEQRVNAQRVRHFCIEGDI